MISNLKEKTEKQKESVDNAYMKKIASLEEQLRFEKSRLDAFERNPVNWDSFKPGFLKEMDKIGKTAKDLSATFRKAGNKVSTYTQTDTYMAKLAERN